jgi:predicted MFS family arabinose efflux permease
MSSFGLGIWIFEQTRSSTLYALNFFCIALPGILVAPIAGPLIDRWDRRRVLIVSDALMGLLVLAVLTLLLAGRLALWQIYLYAIVNAVCSAFQRPAYIASVPLLVEPRQFMRANGMMQLGVAVATLIGPLLAGALIVIWQLQGLLLIDVISFSVAVLMMLLVRFPPAAPVAPGEHARRSIRRETAEGLALLRTQPGLLALMLLLGAMNLLVGIVSVLVTPLALSFGTAQQLGLILSVGGSGMLISSVALSVRGGPRRRMVTVFGGLLLSGVCVMLAGLGQSLPLLMLAGFGFFATQPVIQSCAQAIFQSKVAVQFQGRIFAAHTAITTGTLPLAYLVAGPLADRVFEPLLLPGGALAGSVGRLLGVGPGRGTGLLFIVAGTFALLLVLAGALYRPLRDVESALPDAYESPEQHAAPISGVGAPGLAPAIEESSLH